MTARIIIHKMTKTVLVDMDNGAKLKRNLQEGVKLALHEIGINDRREIRRLIRNGPKTGIKHSGLPNRSSKPHESPAEQSGKLSKSVGFKVSAPYYMEVGARVEYAEYLETGTRNMTERPYILKAVNNNARDSQLSIEKHVQEKMSPL